MLHTPSGFVCICPPKSVELGGDGGLHRADHQPELHAELEFAAVGDTGSTYAYKTGGGVRAINPTCNMTLAETETCIAVFKGSLANKAQLAISLGGCKPGLKDAEVLIFMYEKLGVDMLGHLDGAFAFLLYDARQARVLAARDPSGAIPLVQGRTAAGSLLIACGTYLPDGVHDLQEIQPGEFKYGWHAVPRKYLVGCAKQVDTRRPATDHSIRRRSLDVSRAPPSGRRSMDVPTAPPSQLQRRHSTGLDDKISLSSPPVTTPSKLNSNAAPYQPPHLSQQRRASEDGALAGSHSHHAAQHRAQQQQYKRESVLAPVVEETWRQVRPLQARHFNQHHHRASGRRSIEVPNSRQQQQQLQSRKEVPQQQDKQEVPQQQQDKQEAKAQEREPELLQQQDKQEPLQRYNSDASELSTDGALLAISNGDHAQAAVKRRRHRRKGRSAGSNALNDTSTDTDSRSELSMDAVPDVGAPDLVAARSLSGFGPRRNGSCSDLMAPTSSPVLVSAMQGLAC